MLPPPPPTLDPLVALWPAGRELVRVHDGRFGAASFNPGKGRGRFHPFDDARGNVVSVLYAADCLDGALSETLFHSLPPRPDHDAAAEAFLDHDLDRAAAAQRGIRRQRLRGRMASVLEPVRDLALARLSGHGLGRLGVARDELITSPASTYPQTAAWAAALHHRHDGLDGLAWTSRQFDDARAVVLFGDRADGALRIVDSPEPLDLGRGLDRVRRAAELARITLFEY